MTTSAQVVEQKYFQRICHSGAQTTQATYLVWLQFKLLINKQLKLLVNSSHLILFFLILTDCLLSSEMRIQDK